MRALPPLLSLLCLAACATRPSPRSVEPATNPQVQAPSATAPTAPPVTPPSVGAPAVLPGASPTTPSAPLPPGAPPPVLATPVPNDAPDGPFQPGSDLKRSISEWIAQNPGADFDEAARAANRFLREVGYPLVLDVSGLIPPEADSFRMKAGIRTFEFRAGQELSRGLDVCGERYLRIPGRIVSENEAMLVAKEQEYPFSLEGFRRERFRVMKGKRLINTLYAPEPTEPIGLAANGSAVYLKFELDDGLTEEWWQRMGRNQPSLLDEDPYLVVRVSKKSLYFDENLEHLPLQDFEVEQSPKGIFRWKFSPSGLTLELDSQCNTVAKPKPKDL